MSFYKPHRVSSSRTIVHVVTSLGFGGVERHMEVIASVLGYSQMKHMFVAIGKGGAAEQKLCALGADVICLGKKTKIPSLCALKSLLNYFIESGLSSFTHMVQRPISMD